MTDDSLTPLDYQKKREDYVVRKGHLVAHQSVKSLTDAVLSSNDAINKILAATVALAKEQSGLSAEPQARMVDTAIAGGLATITASAAFEAEDIENLKPEDLKSKAYSHVLDESHNDGSVFRTKHGAFSQGIDQSRLVFYRSFSAEELDELGIVLEWEVVEAVDEEPDDRNAKEE